MSKIIISFCISILFAHSYLCAQSNAKNFFVKSDSFNHKRFVIASSFAGISYSVFSIGLYSAWYKKNQLTKFHTFNDWSEWKHMDKFGHFYCSYFQSSLINNGAKWTGLKDGPSLLWSIGISTLFQSTIEIFDAFNPKWGFSWSDIGANLLGSSFFLTQEKLWKEQRILVKFSSHKINYSSESTMITNRVCTLYGSNILERLLKDYNAQVYWLSFNPIRTFNHKKTFWPEYINIAFGYGAQGMYGGTKNEWKDSNGTFIQLSPTQYPRYNQYYLALDLDLRKIPIRNKFLKTSLSILNIFKFPAPALEFNSFGKTKFHWLLF
ncbi:MAG: DUF2279 domain-containing protein [Saprospiraceae bacterium]